MSGNNVGAVWNLGSYAALRYLDGAGIEHGAVGYANPGLAPQGATSGGSMYIEFSNFASSGSVPGDLRFDQVSYNGASATANLRGRCRYDGLNQWEFYNNSWALSRPPTARLPA